MDQDRGYNNYYSSRNSRNFEESSNWRRGSVNWDSQWPTDRYSNSDYYGYTRTDTTFNNYNQSSVRYEEEYCRNLYELDPRTMEFDRLVELLHPKFISEYLNKILTFLKSNNTEICFPHIAPYKEAFLVRIASDHKNLESPAFDETCQSISRSIRDFLYKNNKLFVWSHSYESGKVTKNVLVYKKEYFNNTKSRHNSSSHITDPVSLPVNVISKSSSSEAVHKDSKHKQSRMKRRQIELVSTDFKIQSMKTILDFIKDDTRSLLEYPDLSEVQANFLYCLLSCYDKPDDGAEKSLLLTPLVEALKTYSLKYQFRISKDTNEDDCRCITIEKTSKGKSTENNCNDSLKSPSPSVMDYQDLDDWNTDIENSDTTDHRSDGMPDFGSKLNKNQRKLRYLFDQVTTDFKMTVLQKSLDYLEDDSRSSVQFLNLTIHESRFLKCLNSFPLSKKSYFLIEKQCLPLITKLRRVLEPLKQKHKLRIAMYVHPNNKSCDVEMTKMPKRDRWRRCKNDLRSERKCENNMEQQSDRSETISARDKFLKALSVSSDSEDDYDNRGSINNLKSVDCTKLHSSKEKLDKLGDVRDKNSTHNGIQWQPATQNTVENRDSSNDNTGKGKGRLTKQKTKLLEAMSVPVESDKAMRMMRLMGWQGGALGRRGEGIVEPIIPAIELVTGAGLGHSPGQGKKERKLESKKGEARTAISFRKEFLENVLDLLRKQDITEKEVIYERPLSTKEKRFTVSSLEALNKRRKVGLNTTEEKDSVCRILANLNQMQNLLLTVEFSDSDRQMNITKIASTAKGRSRRAAAERSLDDESIRTSIADRNTVTINDIKKTVVDLMNIKTPNAPSKSLRSHAIKLLVLNKILDFIEDKEALYVDLKFEEKMTLKQRTFYITLVNNLNKKSRFTIGGATENYLYEVIKKKTDCILKLTICQKTYRMITIQKMYYQKRFINTANIQPKSASTEIDRINNSTEMDSESELMYLKQQNVNPVNDTDVESTNDPDLIALDQDLAAIEQELIKEEAADRSFTPDSDVLQSDDQMEASRDTSKEENLTEDIEAGKIEGEKDHMFKMDFEDWIEDDKSPPKSVDKINVEEDFLENILEQNDKTDNVDRKLRIEENSNSVEDFATELSPSSSKRSREDSESSDLQISKKTKVYIDDILKVNIAIVPTTYPEQKLDLNTVKIIQTEVIESIDLISENNYMPRLKCQGIIDGALKFVCKNYDSYLWLKKRISELILPDVELKLIHFTEKSKGGSRKKMMLRLRSYVKEDIKRIFSRIEKINKCVVTKDWMVLNEMWDECNGLLNIILEVDEDSYFTLEKENFSIYTGFDVGVFTEI